MGVTAIAHDVLGSGKPLLLLHAGVADRRMWAGVAGPLAEHRRVITADLPGFGDTPMPSGVFSFAGVVRDLLDELDAMPADVLGCSFSGMVAVQLAVLHPETVRSLVLVSSASDAHEWSKEVRSFGGEEEELLEMGDIEGATDLNVRMWGNAATAEAVRTMQRHAFELQAEAERLRPPAETQWPGPPAFTRLDEITVPTLVVTGGRDYADFIAIGDQLSSQIPGARRAVIKDAGHLIGLEEPDELVRLVQEFLRSEARPAGS
jgi:pimeloyl-ACP methyl ester carboxylesterase